MAAPNTGNTTLPADSAGKSAFGLWGGSAYDAPLSNQSIALLASAARTATTNSATQTNPNARGVLLMLNVTAAGTGHLLLSLIAQGAIAQDQVAITPNITGTGTTQLMVYPGATTGGTTVASAPLPRTWFGVVTHSDSSSWTYSLDAMTIL